MNYLWGALTGAVIMALAFMAWLYWLLRDMFR